MNFIERTELEKFAKEMKVLVVSPHNSDRANWKRLFTQYGVNVNNFFSASDIDEAKGILLNNKVQAVFTDYNIANESCLDLYRIHEEAFPYRSQCLFFVAAEGASVALAATVLEYDIDGFVVKPYNQKDLEENITASIMRKVRLTDSEKIIMSATADIRTKSFPTAEKKIERLKKVDPKNPNIIFLQGLYHSQIGNMELALESWNKALALEPVHHKSLCHLFDYLMQQKIYDEAYQHALVMCKKYPINPTRIPDLIRVSIATNNYNTIVNFCEMFLDVNSVIELEKIQNSIAAGLAISGKHLINIDKQKEIAEKASLKALELASKVSPIGCTAIENLFALKKFKKVRQILDSIPNYDMNERLFLLDIELVNLESGPTKACAYAQKIVDDGDASPAIYKSLIRFCIEIGKNESYVNEVIFKAQSLYPNNKEYFKF